MVSNQAINSSVVLKGGKVKVSKNVCVGGGGEGGEASLAGCK